MRRWGSSGMPKAYLGPGVTSRPTVWLWAGMLMVRRWRSSVPVQSGGPGIDGRLNRVPPMWPGEVCMRPRVESGDNPL